MVLHDVANSARLIVEYARPWTPKSSAMVICMLSLWLRFQNGSRNEFAKRK